MRRSAIAADLLAISAAILAVAASASAAEPAYYECAKVKGGKYEDKRCSQAASTKKHEKYELRQGVSKAREFRGKGGRGTFHTPAVGGEFTCRSADDSGYLTSPTTAGKVVIAFVGCESLGKKCTSAGEKAGSIRTFALEAALGYVNEPKREVGLDLSGEAGGEIARFSCEGLERSIDGSIIGRQTGDIDRFSKTFVLTYRVNGEGFQEVDSLEGQPRDVLEETINGSGPFEAGWQLELSNDGEELEVKA